ncbi:MAG: DUF1638 domain-containing protein [Candidatus Methanomethylophilaceae archaeon]|nr:DUF1638 domain-containing protein [Candidatus Methanomethylophilaceae archaeon]
MARIGLVACDILKNEFEFLLKDDLDFVEKKYLEFALHVDPEHMRDVIIDEVNDMLTRVDAVLLGYAVCSSLDAIEKRFDKPVVKLPGADCIDALLTTEEYNREKKICCGTWFDSPGWAIEGTEGMIKEMHLDMIEGVEPQFFLDMLFESYERVLFIDPGIGNEEEYMKKSIQLSKELKLRHDCRKCDLRQIEDCIRKVKEAAKGA